MPGVYVGATQVPETYYSLVVTSAAKWGVPPELLAAQLNAESGFKPTVVSAAGALGIAQFLPGTAKDNGVDPWNPQSAIDGMAMLDARFKKQFGSWELALAAYNAGPGNVSKYNGIPPFTETQNYVSSILKAAGGAVSGGASATTVGNTTPIDPLKDVTKLYNSLTNVNWWRRLAFGSLGVLVILIAIYLFLHREIDAAGMKIAKSVTGGGSNDGTNPNGQSGNGGNLHSSVENVHDFHGSLGVGVPRVSGV